MLEINNLKKYYQIREKNIFSRHTAYTKAVDDVSFSLNRGETIGLVGESGCGKTTLGRTILKLIEPTAGEVLFNGKNVFELNPAGLKDFHKKVQVIFQDPYSSLNPRMKVSSIVTEGLIIHTQIKHNEIKQKSHELLDNVGLSGELADRYPHEFSGGQRQRIGIARAISLQPEYIICDEPVSSLDVSVQAQIINLLIDLQEKFNLGYIFISHDLSVVKYISHKIAVMYLGQLVEFAESGELFDNPLHPYTKLLLSAVPERHNTNKIAAPDKPACNNRNTADARFARATTDNTTARGCAFYPRCPQAKEECAETSPGLADIGGGHKVSCMLIK